MSSYDPRQQYSALTPEINEGPEVMPLMVQYIYKGPGKKLPDAEQSMDRSAEENELVILKDSTEVDGKTNVHTDDNFKSKLTSKKQKYEVQNPLSKPPGWSSEEESHYIKKAKGYDKPSPGNNESRTGNNDNENSLLIQKMTVLRGNPKIKFTDKSDRVCFQKEVLNYENSIYLNLDKQLNNYRDPWRFMPSEPTSPKNEAYVEDILNRMWLHDNIKSLFSSIVSGFTEGLVSQILIDSPIKLKGSIAGSAVNNPNTNRIGQFSQKENIEANQGYDLNGLPRAGWTVDNTVSGVADGHGKRIRQLFTLGQRKRNNFSKHLQENDKVNDEEIQLRWTIDEAIESVWSSIRKGVSNYISSLFRHERRKRAVTYRKRNVGVGVKKSVESDSSNEHIEPIIESSLLQNNDKQINDPQIRNRDFFSDIASQVTTGFLGGLAKIVQSLVQDTPIKIEGESNYDIEHKVDESVLAKREILEVDNSLQPIVELFGGIKNKGINNYATIKMEGESDYVMDDKKLEVPPRWPESDGKMTDQIQIENRDFVEDLASKVSTGFLGGLIKLAQSLVENTPIQVDGTSYFDIENKVDEPVLQKREISKTTNQIQIENRDFIEDLASKVSSGFLGGLIKVAQSVVENTPINVDGTSYFDIENKVDEPILQKREISDAESGLKHRNAISVRKTRSRDQIISLIPKKPNNIPTGDKPLHNIAKRFNLIRSGNGASNNYDPVKAKRESDFVIEDAERNVRSKWAQNDGKVTDYIQVENRDYFEDLTSQVTTGFLGGLIKVAQSIVENTPIKVEGESNFDIEHKVEESVIQKREISDLRNGLKFKKSLNSLADFSLRSIHSNPNASQFNNKDENNMPLDDKYQYLHRPTIVKRFLGSRVGKSPFSPEERQWWNLPKMTAFYLGELLGAALSGFLRVVPVNFENYFNLKASVKLYSRSSNIASSEDSSNEDIDTTERNSSTGLVCSSANRDSCSNTHFSGLESISITPSFLKTHFHLIPLVKSFVVEGIRKIGFPGSIVLAEIMAQLFDFLNEVASLLSVSYVCNSQPSLFIKTQPQCKETLEYFHRRLLSLSKSASKHFNSQEIKLIPKVMLSIGSVLSDIGADVMIYLFQYSNEVAHGIITSKYFSNPPSWTNTKELVSASLALMSKSLLQIIDKIIISVDDTVSALINRDSPEWIWNFLPDYTLEAFRKFLVKNNDNLILYTSYFPILYVKSYILTNDLPFKEELFVMVPDIMHFVYKRAKSLSRNTSSVSGTDKSTMDKIKFYFHKLFRVII